MMMPTTNQPWLIAVCFLIHVLAAKGEFWGKKIEARLKEKGR
jgi:hypothetical protein